MRESDDPLPIHNILLIAAFLFNAVFLAGSLTVDVPVFDEIPETIMVRITGQKKCTSSQRYKTVEIDFKEYVKGVLGNEWGLDWHEDSLKAGAIAVKMYAWSMIESRGYVWDCTWSQVYNPNIRSDETDKAVDDTWDYYLFKDGEPVRTFYNAWLNGCNIRGESNCMGQWRSLILAEEGMNWKDILAEFYDGHLVFNGYTIPRTSNRRIQATR